MMFFSKDSCLGSAQSMCIWICKPMHSSATAIVDILAEDFLPTLMSHMMQIVQTSLDNISDHLPY